MAGTGARTAAKKEVGAAEVEYSNVLHSLDVKYELIEAGLYAGFLRTNHMSEWKKVEIRDSDDRHMKQVAYINIEKADAASGISLGNPGKMGEMLSKYHKSLEGVRGRHFGAILYILERGIEKGLPLVFMEYGLAEKYKVECVEPLVGDNGYVAQYLKELGELNKRLLFGAYVKADK